MVPPLRVPPLRGAWSESWAKAGALRSSAQPVATRATLDWVIMWVLKIIWRVMARGEDTRRDLRRAPSPGDRAARAAGGEWSELLGRPGASLGGFAFASSSDSEGAARVPDRGRSGARLTPRQSRPHPERSPIASPYGADRLSLCASRRPPRPGCDVLCRSAAGRILAPCSLKTSTVTRASRPRPAGPETEREDGESGGG